jgi:2-polyprenyl-6-methoxyphenol hydroxylase-like FAD-dependent oxidoreductase
MLPVFTDVLIVGAGPTGLALATALQQSGVDHLVVDALPQGLNTSRAAVIHAHTMEMLEGLDVAGRIDAEARRLERFVVRDRDAALLEIGFGDLPSAYRCTTMIPQPRTEAILEARLVELGGQVRRGVELLDLRRDRDGVLARLAAPDGEALVRARYVVGADGMHSVVRQSTSIRFEGEAYPESFVLADVEMDWPLGRDEVSLCFSPAGLVVVAPLPDGSYRVVATMDGAPERPGIGMVRELLATRGPVETPASVRKVVWSSRFRVHHRLASSYRDGRILLMGDAAHVHSPAGGQGMNTGLVDAVVLARALAAVLREGAAPETLDRYAELRRPAAAKVLALASRLTRVATLHSPLGRRLRNAVLRLLDRMPAVKRRLALQLSGIARRDLSVLPLALLSPMPAGLPAGRKENFYD